MTPERKSGEWSVWGFFGLALALSWITWLPLVLWPERSQGLDALLHVGAFGPWLAAILLTWRRKGRAGLGRWLRRTFNVRIGLLVYLAGALLIPLGVGLLHLGLVLALGGRVDWSQVSPWYYYPAYLLPTALLGGGQEEPGWRGYALPKLLERVSPLVASCITAPFWAAWHLPLALSTAWDGAEEIVLMFLYTIPLSIILTWLTGTARGSAIPAILAHAGTNVYGRFVPLPPVTVGGLTLGFTALKTIVYAVIAVALLVATKGQLVCARDLQSGAYGGQAQSC
jgi:membrane protease YdiL (CAAX protease family)